MIYLIYGDQYPLINKRAKKIIKSILGDEIDDFSLVKINAREVLVQDIAYECSLLPLGGKKVIRVDEPYFLSTSREKVSIDKEQDYESLINFINNDQDDMINLIFVLETKNLNKKSNVYKALEDKAEIIYEEGLSIDSLKSTGVAFFKNKGANISFDALNELLFRINEDVSLFIKEAEKLSLYSKNITIDDVKLLVPLPLEQNAFSMCEDLLSGRISNAIKTFRDLLILKEEPVRILNLLSSQFRFYYQVLYLSNVERYDQTHIADELKVHPYRVKIALNKFSKYPVNKIAYILDSLYELDVKIKSMEIEPSIGLELFMVNINN